VDPRPSPTKVVTSEYQHRLRSFPTWKKEGLLNDDNARPRLLVARDWYRNLEQGEIDTVVKLFREWCAFDEYGVIQLERRVKHPFRGFVWKREKTIALKSSKRGNDVYRRRVLKRLANLREIYDRFGDLELVDTHSRTRVLMVTLTFDIKLTSIRNAWEGIGRDWNRFISACRRRWGRIIPVRTWESFGNGYPHIHALLLFEDTTFGTYTHENDKGEFELRCVEKKEFERYHHSFIDIEVPRNIKFAVGYIIKYLGKIHSDPNLANDGGIDTSNAHKTLALTWLYRKKSFSIGRDIQKQLSEIDLIDRMRYSNFFSDFQVSLDGVSLPKEFRWRWMGVFSAWELGLKGRVWCVELDFAVESRVREWVSDGEAFGVS
jgi:hypothetical protein